MTLIVATLMVTMVAGRIYLGAAASVPPEPRIVKPQQKISLPNIDFKQSQKTLLLVLSSTCPFCSRSMPFYQRMMQSKGEHARVIVVGGEDERTLSNYLKINEVPVDGIATVTAANTPSQVTPTAILVDPEGVVRNVWRGQLSPQQEAEVVQLLSK